MLHILIVRTTYFLNCDCINFVFTAIEPEANPKWETLTEVLKEIHKATTSQSHVVLILVDSHETCYQLKQVRK